MALHKNVTTTDVHVIHAFEYADESTRVSASVVSADIGKMARQLDNETFWVLTATAPTWVELTSIATAQAEQVFLFARKKTTGSIGKGKPVHAAGQNAGGWLEVEEAEADVANKMPAIGLAFETLNEAETKKVIAFGKIEGIDTSAFTIGDGLYVQSISGTLGNSKPTGSFSEVQRVACVLKVDASTGRVLVSGAGRANDIQNITSGSILQGGADDFPVEVVLNHGTLSDLGNDDHPHYTLTSAFGSHTSSIQTHSASILNASGTFAIDINRLDAASGTFETHRTDGTVHYVSGVIQHDALVGLSNDDHTQYLLRTEYRTFTGSIVEHTSSILEASGTFSTDINRLDAASGTFETHRTNTSNPHATSIANIGAGTLAQLNTAVSDATLDNTSGARTPLAHSASHFSGASDPLSAQNLGAFGLDIDRLLITNGTGGWTTVLSSAVAGSGGGSQMFAFDPNEATFSGSTSAQATSRNSHPLLAFDDTIAELIIFNDSMSEDYDSGADLLCRIDWISTVITGGVTWGVEFERIAPGGTAIVTDSFDVQQTGSSTTNVLTGTVTRTTITLINAQADGMAKGDAFRLRVQRVVSDSEDDLVGDAEIFRVTGVQT